MEEDEEENELAELGHPDVLKAVNEEWWLPDAGNHRHWQLVLEQA